MFTLNYKYNKLNDLLKPNSLAIDTSETIEKNYMYLVKLREWITNPSSSCLCTIVVNMQQSQVWSGWF